MASRAIHLRWPGHCSECGGAIRAGVLAVWDDATHDVTCLDCVGHEGYSLRPPTPPEVERERIRELIREARAALDAGRRAG